MKRQCKNYQHENYTDKQVFKESKFRVWKNRVFRAFDYSVFLALKTSQKI